MKIAIVAGETSGDLLAADLLRALQTHIPDLQAEGVTGPALRAAGCHSLEDMQALSVMGISEVIGELPRLFELRKRLLQRWLDNPPDIMIGIDAPDFNLGLEKRLKAKGIRTVHYVSPTVWAWRPKRVHTVAAAADLLLCLFPFEPDCYVDTAVRTEFVGHPFAAQILQVPSKTQCREQLDLADGDQVLAVLPGSRVGEVRALGQELVQSIAALLQRLPNLRVVVPAANEKVATAFTALLEARGLKQRVTVVDGRMREVVRAADAAIVMSGTATLETMLLGTPFVVAYKASPFTAWLLRGVGMLKIQQVALPNILAGREVAPELLQGAAAAENLCASAYLLLTRPHLARAQLAAFGPLAKSLDQPSGELAAQALLKLCAAE